MKKFLEQYSSAIWAGFLLGIVFFFLTSASISSSSLFSADLTIPYQNTDADLQININTDDAVTEGSIDAGAEATVQILTTVFYYMKILLGILAVLWIVLAGVYLISNAHDEEKVTSAKRMGTYAVMGLVAILLAEPFILDVLYGGRDIEAVSNIDRAKYITSASNFRIQVDGVIAFFKTLLVFIAMTYIIFTGARMIFAFGDDEQLSSAKQMFIPIIFGILIILFNEVFIDTILYQIIFDGEKVQFTADSSNAHNFIVQLVGFLQYIFGFIAIIALGFIIYGGFLYIVSFGNDEGAEKGKKILIRTAIGVVILILSFVIMMSLVNFEL